MNTRNPSPAVARSGAVRSLRSRLAAAGFAALLTTPAVGAAETGNWIGTWTASPQPIWGADFVLPAGVPETLSNQTIRQVVRASLGGKRVRIVLSNAYGDRPLTISAAHVALAAGGSAIVAGTDRPLTFGGRTTVRVPPGAPIVSDPVDLAVAPLGELAVSLFLPEPTPVRTFHWDGRQTAAIAAGNLVAAPEIKAEATVDARIFLSGILADVPAGARTVVTLGDSITDGNGSTKDTNRRWPDYLAKRLVGENVSVLNAGISGARLLKDMMGENALARFDRDVLSKPHVAAVIVKIGTNDIGWPGGPFAPSDPLPTIDDLVAGYRQLIDRAHARNIRIIGATLTPFERALEGTPLEGHYSPEKDRLRQAVNAWIRSSGAFDAVIDFDAVTRDPAHPSRFLPAFDSGDHLHPGDAGYQAMADAIDLRALLGPR